MPEIASPRFESADLGDRLRSLEETQRATLNILEDFDEEKGKLKLLQQATLNILEDFDGERRNSQLIQKATLNLLEDFDEERRNSQRLQKATLNLLEDMHEEQRKLDDTQRALMNMLEDIEVERADVERAKSLLETVNKELEAFSYSVSHDLRAPLRAISGFAEALFEDCAPRLDAEGKRYLKLIQDNAHKMGQLIDDLLAFSRLGRQQMTEHPIDMGALAKAVFAELAGLTPQRRLALSIGAVPPALGDGTLVRQVLVNLFSNAVKFTKTKAQAWIEFGYLPDAAGGAYYVKDNGVGFDMQYAGKLFGVFQRLHAVTEFEGTGVGLALVQRIVTRHGGRVWAEGAVDQGAIFYFTLPQGEAA
jgi:light-regulated signal transduction histidine kinase (bacteriophytochrome)